MAENDHRLRCPVCQGHGEFRRSEILNLLSDPDFKKRLDIYLAELRRPTEDCEGRDGPLGEHRGEIARVWHGNTPLEPQLPIWQRSPKESCACRLDTRDRSKGQQALAGLFRFKGLIQEARHECWHSDAAYQYG